MMTGAGQTCIAPAMDQALTLTTLGLIVRVRTVLVLEEGLVKEIFVYSMGISEMKT